MQIGAALSAMVDIPWPAAFQQFLSAFALINIDFVPPSFECAITMDFYDKMFIVGASPIIVFFLILLEGL